VRCRAAVRDVGWRRKGIGYTRRLLGHVNITTPQPYMHLDERELADVQDLVD
jgi:site-specific recombinase XerC